jgi:hypothetical protein
MPFIYVVIELFTYSFMYTLFIWAGRPMFKLRSGQTGFKAHPVSYPMDIAASFLRVRLTVA